MLALERDRHIIIALARELRGKIMLVQIVNVVAPDVRKVAQNSPKLLLLARFPFPR